VPASLFAGLPGVDNVSAEDTTLRMQVHGPIGRVLTAAAPHDLVDMESREPSLEEIFLTFYGRHETDAHDT